MGIWAYGDAGMHGYTVEVTPRTLKYEKEIFSDPIYLSSFLDYDYKGWRTTGLTGYTMKVGYKAGFGSR